MPESVRDELSSRLNRLHQYFPEIKLRIKVGITRAYDGFVFPPNKGHPPRLLIKIRRTKTGVWKYPTYWTLAHELMHLTQFNVKILPATERATDIYALARIPLKFIDEPPSYLTMPKNVRKRWIREHAKVAHELALRALEQRNNGLRRYAKWWETEFSNSVSTNHKGYMRPSDIVKGGKSA